ncbi:periplasmic chaperone for outer membrane proteins Skp [Chitinophaga skermanii]|uniref:Periplasmic chaperone for outer membrane proteins Skp n=1 Tax=Chitinophaga skermanii TaxID=331697 RepID=A0A327R1F2_9BACT|nr:OmpH family outer membrane protein [Chitinophaga skermanii]RAJ10480.1 periplasmic chaperone for outer membrane proteins Skp [Chitinophaga skermanii]
MKKYVIIALVAIAGLVSANKATAQSKVGHINAQALIESLPETKTAITKLQAYADTLERDGKSLVDEYTKKVSDFEKTASTLSENIRDVKAREIQDAQKRIQDYNQAAEQKIEIRRGELLKPVYDKAKKAIDDVAKEKGYNYVIDNSAGILLVMPTGDDILPLVKTKLGVK